MTDLEFRDELTVSKFTFGNNFNYGDSRYENTRVESDIYFGEKSKELLYFLRQSYTAHGNNILFATVQQFRGRQLSAQKIQDIANSCVLPICVNFSLRTFAIAKGFIADYTNNEVIILFGATISKENFDKPLDQLKMEDIKFYVSKEIYHDHYKAIHGIVKNFIKSHPGEVIVTPNINKYLSLSLDIPSFTTLSKRREYTAKMVQKCFTSLREKAGYIPKKKTQVKAKRSPVPPEGLYYTSSTFSAHEAPTGIVTIQSYNGEDWGGRVYLYRRTQERIDSVNLSEEELNEVANGPDFQDWRQSILVDMAQRAIRGDRGPEPETSIDEVLSRYMQSGIAPVSSTASSTTIGGVTYVQYLPGNGTLTNEAPTSEVAHPYEAVAGEAIEATPIPTAQDVESFEPIRETVRRERAEREVLGSIVGTADPDVARSESNELLWGRPSGLVEQMEENANVVVPEFPTGGSITMDRDGSIRVDSETVPAAGVEETAPAPHQEISENNPPF